MTQLSAPSPDDFPAPPRSRRFAPWLASLFLLALVALPYWRVQHQQFVNYDDDRFVYQNAFINRGLTMDGMRYAFGIQGVSQWHPLTFVTHMIDIELFDFWAGGHKIHNVLYHALNTVLLFHLLRLMTGRFALALVAALIWGIHPLRVEGVAWVAERKEVLSTFFGLLTLLAYWAWASRKRWWWYALMLVLFSCALMSKPMWVTAPCIMLLLDYWPLRRMGDLSTRDHWRRLGWLIVEKLPMFPLIAGASYMTILCQFDANTVSPLSSWPWVFRICNAVIAYWWYIRVTLIPHDLCTLYMLDPFMSYWVVGLSIAGLVIVSWLALRWWRRHPWLIVGWLIFVGTLVPTIGLFQVGSQRWADRYSYLPSIGLMIVLVWGVATIVEKIDLRRSAVGLAVGLWTVVLLAVTALQVNYWFHSEILWLRCLDVDPDNTTAINNLGVHYLNTGNPELAEAYFMLGISKWGASDSLVNMASIHIERGDTELAKRYAQRMLSYRPSPSAYIIIGNAFMLEGNVPRAIRAFQLGLELNPVHGPGLQALGNALATAGHIDEATVIFERALQLYPRSVRNHTLLAEAYIIKDRLDEAEALLNKILQERPDHELSQRLLRRAQAKREGDTDVAQPDTIPYQAPTTDIGITR
jgi:tetratricopeptide (TPR) repeat protein